MKALTNKVALWLVLLLVGLVGTASDVQAAACASPAAATSCVLDQQMWLNGGGDGFGAGVKLGQTFVPSVTGRICKITVLLRKNNPAGPVLLRVLVGGPSGAELVRMTKVVNAMGGPQVVDFNFACSTPALLGGNRYFLELSATTSPPNSYTWINSQGAGGDGAFLLGHGWHSVSGWRPYDYAFRFYRCT